MPIESQEKKYTRVTEILARYQNTDWFTAESRERGTAVHKWCAAYAKGLWCPIEPQYQGYCDSFARWFDLTIKEILLVERRFFDDDLCISGQLDLVCIFQGDKGCSLIDTKTGEPSIVAPTQLGAYHSLLKKNTNIEPKRFLCIRPDKAGAPAHIKEYSALEIAQAEIIFYQMVSINNYLGGLK